MLRLVYFLGSKVNGQKYGARCQWLHIQFEALQVQQHLTKGENLFGFTENERLFQQLAMFAVPIGHRGVSYADVGLINIFGWFVVKIRRHCNPCSVNGMHWSCQLYKFYYFLCLILRVRADIDIPIPKISKPKTVNDLTFLLLLSSIFNFSAAPSIRRFTSSGTGVGRPKLKIVWKLIISTFGRVFNVQKRLTYNVEWGLDNNPRKECAASN